jgi:hypothetical protein
MQHKRKGCRRLVAKVWDDWRAWRERRLGAARANPLNQVVRALGSEEEG